MSLFRRAYEVNIFYKIVELLVKVIKFMLFSLLLLLLSPIVVLNYFFILYTVIGAPPNDEIQGSKGQALHEALEMSISSISVLYKQFMNEEIANNEAISSKFVKSLIRGIIYIIALILSIGAILNMCISVYYIINKDKILQENIELKQEVASLEKNFRAYGRIYNFKSVMTDKYDHKIDKIEKLMFEYQVETRKSEVVCVEVMEENNFKFVNEIEKGKAKTLVFKRNEYITEIQFLADKDTKITFKRYNSFRESRLYAFLSPIIRTSSLMNPFRSLEG